MGTKSQSNNVILPVSTKVAIREVQLVEEEREVLEDVGRILEAKVVEDLLGLLLPHEFKPKEAGKIELIEFLTANIEVFS